MTDTSGRRPSFLKRWLRRLLWLTAALVAVVVMGLWGSNGHLPALIAGQRDLGPELTNTAVSVRPPEGLPPIEVEVSVDFDRSLRTVDQRYLSFAIDTSAVVGGKWWDPKAAGKELGSGTVNAPIFDFDRPRLDALTRALAPAYLRIGGSEADKVHYDMSGASTSTVPPGFKSVLTRAQWDAVNAFAGRNGLDLVMTLNAGPGSRDDFGRWRSENAESLLAYSRASNYAVPHWELGNELNLFWFVHGLFHVVSVDQFAEDLKRARALVKKYYPNAEISGQSAAFWPVLGEPLQLFFGVQAKYARVAGTQTDTFGWHFYPQQSRRGPVASRRATPGRLLEPRNLDEVAHWARFNIRLRDAFSPGRPLWLGETGNAQFGGEPGLSDRYLASLWWLDQLGLLARLEHDVVVRQTLSGSNYQLITDDTLQPLPDYWASLLWKRLMGVEVLAVRASGADNVRIYAHRGVNVGTATVLVINHDHRRTAVVRGLNASAIEGVYAVTAPDVLGTRVLLNGEPINMIGELTVPTFAPTPLREKNLTVHPLSYTFVTFRL